MNLTIILDPKTWDANITATNNSHGWIEHKSFKPAELSVEDQQTLGATIQAFRNLEAGWVAVQASAKETTVMTKEAIIDSEGNITTEAEYSPAVELSLYVTNPTTRATRWFSASEMPSLILKDPGVLTFWDNVRKMFI